MQSLNVFSDEKPEGRLDVGRALGSTALTMFVYDLEPGSSSARTTTSTRMSGS